MPTGPMTGLSSVASVIRFVCYHHSHLERRPGNGAPADYPPVPRYIMWRSGVDQAVVEVGKVGCSLNRAVSSARAEGRGPHGHHPYMENDCCLLRKTTNRAARNRARRKARHMPARAWSPGVRVESRRRKSRPWRPPESTSPLAKSFVLRQTVCNRLIFLKWHGRGREFESHQVHQNKPQ